VELAAFSLNIKRYMRVSKRGSSLAVRIPAALVKELELKAGDEIELVTVGERDFVIRRKPAIEELMDQIRKPNL
jgi:antitoxin MazE